MNLILNAIQCLLCKEIIVSRHRHDFKSCKCGKVSVDGGLYYRKRVGTHYAERCAYERTGNPLSDGNADEKFIVWSPGGSTNPALVFDSKEDAQQSARELAARVPSSDWYVAQLSYVPIES